MKRIRKSALISLLIFSMLMSSFSVSSFASENVSDINTVEIELASGETIEIASQDLDQIMAISEDVAEDIALSFLHDALSFEDVVWDDNTEIVATRRLYDQSEEPQITAYSFELTSGYIMVSAYWDASSLIPEWADEAEPIYSGFELDSDDEVVYLGPYDFYKDSGYSKVEDIYGNEVSKDSLENHIEELRSVDNAPASLIEDVIAGLIVDDTGVGVCATITDPIDDAEDIYNESFVCSDYINTWGAYTPSFYTTSSTPSDYKGECGPVTITNMVLTYKNRYPSCISIPTRTNLFINIATIGINNGYYYTNSEGGGTYSNTAGEYVEAVFDDYAITTAVSAKLSANYANIKYQLERGALLYYGVVSHPTYGNHAVMGFAYTRLIGQTTGVAKVYVKVADAWNTSARYIDISSSSGHIYGVTFP